MFDLDREKIVNLKEQLVKVKKISLIGHTSPDGDAVSSVLALYLALNKYTGAEVFPLLPDEVPNYVKWFEHVDRLIIGDRAGKILMDSDIIFCLDFNEVKRVNHLSEYLVKSEAKKVLIDHHPNPEKFADFIFSYPQASSAAEIVYYFIKALDKTLIDRNIAVYLFAGILTDTGVFIHDSADWQTLAVASELLQYGIDKGQVINNLFNNYSQSRMRLMGYLLYKKMELTYDQKVAVITLDQRTMRKFNFRYGDQESIANLPLSIKGVEISIFVMEMPERLKISFRSKGQYNVNMIARDYFFGGGHKNAAGGEFKGSLHKFNRYLRKTLFPNLKKYKTT